MKNTLLPISAGTCSCALRRGVVLAMVLSVGLVLSAFSGAAQTTGQLSAQSGWLGGGSLIGPSDLLPDFAGALQRMGGRMMSASKANVAVTGTVTDANGSRPATITVQAPGYLRYQESSTSRVLTFNGSAFSNKSGKIDAADTPVIESLLTNFPDAVFLQLARKGLLRRIGSGFRTDDGTTANYQGPWWTLYAFAPRAWPGLAIGQPLQQDMLVAIDQSNGLLSEVRVVHNFGQTSQHVTQTQYSGWFQQLGQWYPGKIVRLEDGQQVLSFQSSQASVGPQTAVSLLTQP